MNQQLCIIHGGDTFASYDEYLDTLRSKEVSYERLLYSPSWRNWLAEQLNDWDVIMPSMPGAQTPNILNGKSIFQK